MSQNGVRCGAQRDESFGARSEYGSNKKDEVQGKRQGEGERRLRK
jgi:hypothetical protein